MNNRSLSTKQSLFQNLLLKSVGLIMILLCTYFMIDLSMEDAKTLLTVSNEQRTKSKFDFYVAYKQQAERPLDSTILDVTTVELDESMLRGWQEEKIQVAKLMWQLFAIDNGFDPLFVCGLIGNMYGEGSFGLIEGSYVNKFSSYNLVKLSYSSRIGDIEAARAVCNYDISDSCGIGAVQWSFRRRAGLLAFYENEYRTSGKFGIDEIGTAELKYMLYEFQNDFSNIYTAWQSVQSSYKSDEERVMSAAGIIVLRYEKPSGHKVVDDSTFFIPQSSHFYADRYIPAMQFYTAIGGRSNE